MLTKKPSRILRSGEVIKRVNLSYQTIRRRIQKGTFPQSISLTPNARGWLESEIEAWIAERFSERKAPKSCAENKASSCAAKTNFVRRIIRIIIS